MPVSPHCSADKGFGRSLGATGAVGKPLLATLLNDSSYTSVYSFVRRQTDPPASIAPGKQFNEVQLDFEKLLSGDDAEKSKLSSVDADAIFITLGTTRAQAGSAAAFEKIDRDYVVSAARAAKPTGKAATVVYCSSKMASSGASFLYPKSKGLTEEALAGIFEKTIIMRPGYLGNAQRPQTRILEKMSAPMFSLLATVSSGMVAPVQSVAKVMVKAAELGPAHLREQKLASALSKTFNLPDAAKSHTVAIIENAEILTMARE